MGIEITVTVEQHSDTVYTYYFEKTRIVVGKKPGCDVQLPNALLCDEQFELNVDDSGVNLMLLDTGIADVRIRQRVLHQGPTYVFPKNATLHVLTFQLTYRRVDNQAVTSRARSSEIANLLGGILADAVTLERDGHFLLVEKGAQLGQCYEYDQRCQSITIGRGTACEIYLSDPGVSREQALVEYRHDSLFVSDLGARNKTTVNNRLARRTVLCPGDTIELGGTVIRHYLTYPHKSILELRLGKTRTAVPIVQDRRWRSRPTMLVVRVGILLLAIVVILFWLR